MSNEKVNLEVDLENNLDEQHQVRLEKLAKMKKANIDPWPGFMPVDYTAKEVLENYQEDDSKKYNVAGRVISLRWHGKSAFLNILDRSGKIQVYLKLDLIGKELFENLENFLDLGDIVYASGNSFKTRTGEVTLKADKVILLSKCLRPLPEKFHGLSDTEAKYRQRYLDLISNLDSREKFRQRSKIISQIRSFLESRDFIEVETPILHPIPGGAAAKPFVTHHNALDSELFLRIAPELYLKRLVVGGFERVFEINRSFRNEGVSTRHNPEFTMLEFYMAHQDYNYAMDLVEKMFGELIEKVFNTKDKIITWGEHKIDFSKFERISIDQALIKYGKLTSEDINLDNIDKLLKKYKIDPKKYTKKSIQEKRYVLFEEVVEDKLINPTFIIDFPIEVSPLSKPNKDNPNIVDRFELFIGGMEISNCFNELNDPIDQANRFKEQAKNHISGDEEAHRYDSDYVNALEYALPPTVGVGIGIDRLVMLLTNTLSIKDVILFPTLKNKI